MKLKIADNLTLPLDVVTQTIAVLAKRRAGKSYTMRRLVEQLFKAGQQVVIVDPKGDQWGVRSAADGKGPGLAIVILGGERGDVPLEPSGGEVVAKLVVEERVSVLLDISLFRKHEVATFMTAFLENLYRLKAREIYRTPMMLVIDEADAIAPQRPQKGEERMLGAAEDIVRRGGQRGIGCVLVSQRSAVLNKNVLTQSQILVALRTIAPQDLDAMQAWIDVHGTPEQRKTLMESLPSLPVGDAWFWSPGWPTTDGIFMRVHVLPIETFDSGATPEPGVKRVEPKHAADVDLEALKRQMAATIEKAKAEDPRELKRQIADLKKQLAARPKEQITEEKIVEKIVEVPVLKNGQLAKTAKAADRAEALGQKLMDEGQRFLTEAGELRRVIAPAFAKTASVGAKSAPPAPQRPAVSTPRPPAAKPVQQKPPTHIPDPDGSAPPEIGNSGLRRMLVALAQRPQGLSASQIGVRAGLSSGSGTFTTYLSRARSAGWIVGESHHIRITDDGLAALGDYDPLPTGQALLDYWIAYFGQNGAARMLRVIADAYPRSLTHAEIGEACGLALSGTFTTYLSRLRSLELIEGRSEVRASAELFE